MNWLLERPWFEWLGFAAFISNVWGNMMLARLQQGGWLVRLLTNVGWVIYALHTDGGWPMMLNHIVFFYINIDGWLSWRKARVQGLLK